jgi:DNA-binding NtrC family response regulator
VFPIHLPPLRERREDVPLLAESFVSELGPPRPLPEDVRKYLSAQPWKGNVRELRNAVERAVVLAGDGPLRAEHFQTAGRPGAAPPPPGTLDGAERQHILDALARNGWHRDRTARELGISLSTLKRRLREYGFTGAPGSDES